MVVGVSQRRNEHDLNSVVLCQHFIQQRHYCYEPHHVQDRVKLANMRDQLARSIAPTFEQKDLIKAKHHAVVIDQSFFEH